MIDLNTGKLFKDNLRGLYNDEEHDEFITQCTDYLIQEVCNVLKEDIAIEEETKKMFPEIEPTICETRKVADFKEKKRRMEMNYPLHFAESEEREYYIYLKNKSENCPLVFSCYLSMIWGGSYDEYEGQMMAKYEEIQQRLDVGHISNEEFEQTINEELPNPALEIYSSKIDNLEKIHFSFANNPYKKLMKHERALSSAVCVFNEYGEIIEKVDGKNRNGICASYKVGENYLLERKDDLEEDAIVLKVNRMKSKGGKYALIYLFGENFDKFTPTIDDLKIAQYRLFNRKSGINYFKGSFEKQMDNLFLMDFGIENKGEEDEEHMEKRNCIVGCFLVYHDEGKGWGFDHLRAQGFGYDTENQFLTKVGKRVVKMHHRANMKNLLAYWNKKLHEDQNLANTQLLGQTSNLFGTRDNRGAKSDSNVRKKRLFTFLKNSKYHIII